MRRPDSVEGFTATGAEACVARNHSRAPGDRTRDLCAVILGSILGDVLCGSATAIGLALTCIDRFCCRLKLLSIQEFIFVSVVMLRLIDEGIFLSESVVLHDLFSSPLVVFEVAILTVS